MGVKEVLHGHSTRISEMVGYHVEDITTETVSMATLEGD